MSPPPLKGCILEQLGLAVEYADAGGTAQLVTRKSVEVAIEILHVDPRVGRRLGAVEQHRHTAGACAMATIP
jgi:hypothetical protein